MLSNKFVASDIITKVVTFLKKISTSLKHKRHEFDVADLIGSLYVEKRARSKGTCEKRVEYCSAKMAQKKNYNASDNKKRNKRTI